MTNNPLRFTDPTGHMQCEDYQGSCVSENSVTKLHQRKQEKIKEKSRRKNMGRDGNRGGPVLRHNGPFIGVPQNVGEYLSGIYAGSGGSNLYYVGGYTLEEEGVAGSSAGLQYGASYSIEFFENGALLSLSEYYRLNPGTQSTDIASAGAILNVKTADNVAHMVPLGELQVGSQQERHTAITVYGSYPTQMNITLMIELAQTAVVSAPLPTFEFSTSPWELFP